MIEACQTIRLLPPWNSKAVKSYVKEWQELNLKKNRLEIVVQRVTDVLLLCVLYRPLFFCTHPAIANQLQSVQYL